MREPFRGEVAAMSEVKGAARLEAELNAAKGSLDLWKQQWADYSGNNPNEYRSDIKPARGKIASAEAALADFKRKGGPP